MLYSVSQDKGAATSNSGVGRVEWTKDWLDHRKITIH